MSRIASANRMRAACTLSDDSRIALLRCAMTTSRNHFGVLARSHGRLRGPRLWRRPCPGLVSEIRVTRIRATTIAQRRAWLAAAGSAVLPIRIATAPNCGGGPFIPVAGIADLGPWAVTVKLWRGTGDWVASSARFAKLRRRIVASALLLQVPTCLIATALRGGYRVVRIRGVYGAISLAVPGTAAGCAVAYTDKGTGSGYFDVASNTGVALDGTRVERGSAQLEFAPAADAGIAQSNQVLVKHAHSGDNPEADWGRHVLQAARFALQALDQAFPDQAPFTAGNTRIIAAGISNGGGAVLRAAEEDGGLLDGVVAVEPNIWAGEGGRALYDYATEAMLLTPCALLDTRFDKTRLRASPRRYRRHG